MMNDLKWGDVPSITNCCKNVVEELMQPRNVFWHFPELYKKELDFIQSLKETIRDYSEHWTGKVEELRLDKEEVKNVPPPHYLKDYFQTDSSFSFNIKLENLLSNNQWPNILIISGLENLENEDYQSWKRFLGQWAHLSHNASSELSNKVFLAVLEGSDYETPRDDVSLKNIYFHEIFSQTDLKFISRYWSSNDYGNDDLWIESVLVEIAGDDPFLLKKLIEEKAFNKELIWQSLIEYGSELGWKNKVQIIQAVQEHIDKLGYHTFKETSIEKISQYWPYGMFSFTKERGLELHSAVFPILQEKDKIDNRIWRAQISLLYTTFDIIRQKISKFLTENYGPEWQFRAVKTFPNDVIETVDGPIGEISHLKKVIYSLNDDWGKFDIEELKNQIRLLLDLRNKLAHYKPISRKDFDKLLQTIESM